MLAFVLPAFSKRFCNSLCCYFENGNESTPVPWHKNFPYLLQTPGHNPQKLRKTMTHIQQPTRVTHTEQL